MCLCFVLQLGVPIVQHLDIFSWHHHYAFCLEDKQSQSIILPAALKNCAAHNLLFELLTPKLLTGRCSEWRRGCRGTLPFSIWTIATSIYVAFSMFVVFDNIRQNIRAASSLTASQFQSWISTCSSALAWFAWSLASLIVRQSHDA